MTREQRVRAYGAHLALRTSKRGKVFILRERYGAKRKVGTYRSLEALERGIERYGDRTLREMTED